MVTVEKNYLFLDLPGDGDRFLLLEEDFLKKAKTIVSIRKRSEKNKSQSRKLYCHLLESSEDSSLDGEERFLLALTGDGDIFLFLERDFLKIGKKIIIVSTGKHC